jgi:hypothetical protein
MDACGAVGVLAGAQAARVKANRSKSSRGRYLIMGSICGNVGFFSTVVKRFINERQD